MGSVNDYLPHKPEVDDLERMLIIPQSSRVCCFLHR